MLDVTIKHMLDTTAENFADELDTLRRNVETRILRVVLKLRGEYAGSAIAAKDAGDTQGEKEILERVAALDEMMDDLRRELGIRLSPRESEAG